MARTKTSGDVTVMFAFSSQIDCRWCFNNWVTIHDIPSNMESQGWSQFTLVLLDLTHDCWFSSANFLAKRYWNNGMTMDDPQSQILFILGVSGKLSWIIWMTQGVTVICGEFFLNSLISPVVIKASLPTCYLTEVPLQLLLAGVGQSWISVWQHGYLGRYPRQKPRKQNLGNPFMLRTCRVYCPQEVEWFSRVKINHSKWHPLLGLVGYALVGPYVCSFNDMSFRRCMLSKRKWDDWNSCKLQVPQNWSDLTTCVIPRSVEPSNP